MDLKGKDVLKYCGNLDWFNDSILFLTLSGSHAYGTNIEGSDVDIKGICCEPKEYHFGYLKKFEQIQTKEPYDATVFSLRKFFALAADNNPNILELMWMDPADHVYVHPLMEDLFDIRDQFLSKKCFYTYTGYAVSQLNRIKGHRAWLLNPPKRHPERSDYGLPDKMPIPKDQLAAAESSVNKIYNKWINADAIADKLDESQKIEFKEELFGLLAAKDIDENTIKHSIGIQLGFTSNFLELLDKERKYGAAKREWAQYQTWKKERNPIRAEMEEKYGYDLKHASHLCRLITSCKEILEGKGVIVKRPDAEWLKSIRNGAMTYEEVIEWSDKMNKDLENLLKTTKLPHSPNRILLDEKCVQMVQEFLQLRPL